MSRARWALIAAGVVVFVLVASQILIPAIAERKVENRLTAGGGTATVTVGAVPALRLLFGSGERLEIDGHDLNLPLNVDQHVFDKLDGFGIVDVALANSKAGPFELSDLTLTRTSSGPYHLVAHGETTTSDLVDAGVGEVSPSGVSLLDSLAEAVFGPIDTSVPLNLDMQIASDDGRVQVVSGNATIAGIDAGPLAELITSAIVVSI